MKRLATVVSLALLPLTVVSTGPAAAEEVRTNPRPVVVPALQAWEGGTGDFQLGKHSRIVLAKDDGDALAGLGAQLAGDLSQITGQPFDVSPRIPQDGDIVLDLDGALADATGGQRFAEEGYRLVVTAQNVTITAPTAKGLYYGTRSLLQILVADQGRDSVPSGMAVDWPNYPVRGFMLDVGRRFFTPEFIRDYLRVMGWFKLNELQIHLNDNGFKGSGETWKQVQSGFRLKSENPELAGLASADGAYDRADWDSFEQTAAANGVTIIPEIDAPAHSLAFIKFKPSLGLNGGDSDHLDLSKPETTEFVKSVFTEFTPWFRSPDVHFGADEYFADRKLYVKYFNDMAAHVRSLGKHPRAWGSATSMTGTADGYDRDVTINSWNNGWYGPGPAVADGYKFINTNDALLYVVPFATYYHPNGLDGRWLYEQWEPNVFAGGQTVAKGEPLLLGAMSAVWNDLTKADYSELDVHRLVEKTFAVLAQKMWSGVKAGVPYSAFLGDVRRLGLGTGLTKVATTMVATVPDEVSLKQPATASGGEADAAFDGDPATRWSSGSGDEASLTVTLARPTAVTGVTLDWAPEYGRDYDVQVTRDGETWITVASRRGHEGGRDALTFDGVTARQVRLVGLRAAKMQDGYSLWSMHVLEAPDLARGKPTTASSAETASFGAEQATDGDSATRWASGYSDNQWLQVDLGAASAVSRVTLDWEGAYGKDYDIQLSDDGTNWRTAFARRGRSGAGVDDITFAQSQARYVRMQGIKRGSGFGYSLYRFEVRSTVAEPDAVQAREVHHVDCEASQGAAPNGSQERPWTAFEQVNRLPLRPGDQLLFKRGTTCRGALQPAAGGTAAAPMKIGAYGEGARPVIDGVGANEAVLLRNIEGVELTDLEITNAANPGVNKAAVRLVLEDYGTGHHYVLKNLDIHDVKGADTKSINGSGGIFVEVRGTKVKTAYDDLLIEGNTLRAIDREGIYFVSTWNRSGFEAESAGEFVPWTKAVIRGNTLSDLGGDGIVIANTAGGLVEKNSVAGFQLRSAGYNAGMWSYDADDTLFQFNEASGGKTTRDGMAYDVDQGSIRTTFQYNYSHDNAGGFFLICNATGVLKDAVIRYNISQNDAFRGIENCSGTSQNTHFYNNTIYIGPGISQSVIQENNTARHEIRFDNNLVVKEGAGTASMTLRSGGVTFAGNALVNVTGQPAGADPRLMGRGTGKDGYKLHATSPAIGAGNVIADNGGRDFYGNPITDKPNIGAFNGTPDNGPAPTPVPIAGGETPLVPNGDFEAGSLTGWTQRNATAGQPAHTGAYAAQFNAPSGNFATIERVVTGLTAGRSYTLSAWVKSDGKPVVLGAKGYGGADVVASSSATAWTKVAVSFTPTGAGATVFCWRPDPGTASCDDILLTPATTSDLAQGKPTTASSSEVAQFGPEKATDGDPATRWASGYTDTEWIQVDLGTARQVASVVLDWEAAHGRDYDIQISADGQTWTTAFTRKDRATPGADSIALAPVSARYVRMQGVKRATGYGYSLFRFEVRAP